MSKDFNDLFDIKLICLRMLHLSEFVKTLRSSVLVVFNNFLLIDATARSKISSDQKCFFIALSLYPLSFFANTPFNTKHRHDLISYQCQHWHKLVNHQYQTQAWSHPAINVLHGHKLVNHQYQIQAWSHQLSMSTLTQACKPSIPNTGMISSAINVSTISSNCLLNKEWLLLSL